MCKCESRNAPTNSGWLEALIGKPLWTIGSTRNAQSWKSSFRQLRAGNEGKDHQKRFGRSLPPSYAEQCAKLQMMTEANTRPNGHSPADKTIGINPERWVQDHGDGLFGFAVSR